MRRIVSTLLLLCVFFTADALEVKNITVKNISTEQGLSHHSVNTVYQDEFGFIWVGTLDGLNRYDGHRFRVFKPDSSNPYSIRENNIRYVCGDGKGHLYIKGLNSLSEFDMRTQRFRMLAEDGVKSIFHDGEELWMSDTKTLSVYNRDTDGFDEVFSFIKENLPDVVINHFIIGRDGKQYISTSKDGIFVISDTGTIIRHLNVRNIHSLFVDSRGNLWVATLNSGSYMFVPGGGMQHYHYSGKKPEDIAFNNVRYFCEDSLGNIWMSTYGGLVKLDTQAQRLIHYRYELQYEALNIRSISPILYDKQGTIWLGSFHNGLSTYNPGTEKYCWYQAKRDLDGRLNSPLISAIGEGDDDNLFLGTEGGWVSMLDRRTGSFECLPAPASLYDMTVKALLYNDREKMLYVSNLFGNVTRISLSGNRPSIFSVPEGVDRMSNIVSMTEYGRDSILLATSEGVKIFDKRNGNISSLETGFKSNYIRQVWDVEPEGDNIWFTTSSDLYCYDIINDMTRRYAFADVISGGVNNHFNHILKDSKGRLWFGSSGSGVFRYDRESDSLSWLGESMSGSVVTALCEDPVSGTIYAATNKGLVSYEPETSQLKWYDISTNFPLTFIRNMYITQDGELFVCNLDGMVSVMCRDLHNQPRDYDVFVSGLMVDNVPCVPTPEESRAVLKEDIMFQKEISLSPRHSSVTFEISCADYLNMSDTKVEYKLEGFDNSFISGSVSSPITYTNLSPGKYTFMVRGKTPDKEGSYPSSMVDIVVDVPFYKTLWFILLVGLTLSVIILYILRMYVLSERLRSRNSANESKLHFFTNISHEFRTPLTLINGQLEILMQQDNLKPSVYSRILSIYRNASTMNSLVNEIVDMMKSEAGKLKLKVARRDIVAFMREIYITFDEYARQREVSLSFESDCDGVFLEFDNRQLEKVFFNLLSNAFKYVPIGGGRISIMVERRSEGIAVRIKDNGRGIKSEHIRHIFELFYQDDKLNASLPGMGSGIGLSLSKAIVEMHGGSISVESVLGEGTCFTVLLKYNPVFSGEVVMLDDVSCDGMRPVLAEYKSEIADAGHPAGSEKGVKMLIVEDSEEIMRLLVSVFSPSYDVMTAPCGEEGLALARKEVPDIIVSDVMMPGMSGIEMCRILRDNIETSHIPIVLLTAYALENYVVEGFSMGADDYVTKPFNVKILVVRCDNLVRGRRRLQEKYQNLPETPVGILTNNGKDQTLLEKAVSIVMEHIDDPEFKIDVFAHELGLSRTYLFSKIKGLTGQSPNEFITTIRLKEAVVRLVGSKEESISEIAYSLGFSSSSYFINCFKARYGKTPAQYRKEYNN